MNQAHFFSLLFTLLSLFAAAQPPDEMPPPPDAISSEDARGDRLDNIASYIDNGTPLLAAFNDMDSLVAKYKGLGLMTAPMCLDLPGESKFRTCMEFEPGYVLMNPSLLKGDAYGISITSMPNGSPHVLALTFLKFTRKGRKADVEFFNKFIETVTKGLKAVNVYGLDDFLKDNAESNATGYRDGYSYEATCRPTLGGEFDLGPDYQGWILVIRTKTSTAPLVKSTLDSTENALLDTEMQKFKLHKAYVDSLSGLCYEDYEVEEVLEDSIYYVMSKPLSPIAQSFADYEKQLRSSLKVDKTCFVKNFESDAFAVSASTPSKQKVYSKAMSDYGSKHVSTAYFYTPINTKVKPEKQNKQKITFAKDIFKSLGLSYHDSLAAYIISTDGYNWGEQKNISYYFDFIENPEEDYRSQWQNIDTIVKGSTANPYFLVQVSFLREITDTTRYNSIIDSLQESNEKAYTICDSTYRLYVKQNKFKWSILPSLAVVEYFDKTALVDAFNTPDTLYKNLKDIVGDTSTINLAYYSYKWSKLPIEDSTKTNIILTYDHQVDAEDPRSIMLSTAYDTKTGLPDSFKTAYTKYRDDILKLLKINLPRDVKDNLGKERNLNYTTSNYCLISKNGIDNNDIGRTYDLIIIYPLSVDDQTFKPYCQELNMQDTTYSIYPPDVLKKALAKADTVWADPIPESFQSADRVVANLKKQGFTNNWIQDEDKYLRIKDDKIYEHFFVESDVKDAEFIMISKRGKTATSVILYYMGTPPAVNSDEYSRFILSCNAINRALGLKTPTKVLSGMSNGQTAEGYTKDGVACSFIYSMNIDDGYSQESKVGMAFMWATKYYLAQDE